ncbi:methylase involved in ubiquinone/menaquinone biosynthesis [Halobacteroides halobius DSM 5150]|uniref:Methylase involved in ubiquinone/menaquinone biosynthesis n=1 Tax=Halobacteroides halobius (strain ATCC 35273 / DSM 5150 / MD-1) TaxID=748449 RepID=L0K9F0_HALHC|nr:class I SAM-dependent methyltransferase [Halobacteroides halobius]AGB40984.1 methylase involved in ubiquinone/menaquinone biosynthesis [Halobacteroides halobius DSM 5150]
MKKTETEKIKNRYNRIASIYDSCEALMEERKMGDWRQNLWQQVADRTGDKKVNLLEAGVGTGKNIPYYPEGTKAYAIDFSKQMLAEARKKAKQSATEVKLFEMDIQNLDFEDNFFDVIITTCVFCSVPDPIKGLKELKRVCKPNGEILMLEHMRSNKEPIGYLMDSINWISLLMWGANINRKTMKNIKEVGFKVVKEEDLWFDIVKELILTPKN